MNLKSGRVTYWHPNVRSGVLRDKHWWGGGTYIYYKPPRLSKAGNVYCIAEEEPIEYERCEPVVSAFHQNSWSYVKRVRNNIGSFALLHSDEQKLRFAGLLKSNRTHNREVAKTFPTDVSMSTGRYNPLTKQI
jgi:hypothetical protein